MSAKFGTVLIIAAIVLIMLALIAFIAPWLRSGYQFVDGTLDASKDVLQELSAQRTLVHVDNTNQSSLIGIVGLVLVVDDSSNGGSSLRFVDRKTAIPDFRPQADDIAVTPLESIRYQGKVSNKISAGGGYIGFAAEMTDDQAAEVLVKDELYVGFKDRGKIPLEKLRKFDREEGKKYFFVEGATLSSTTYRTFKQAESGASIDGTAFKANGKVFVSNDTFAYQPALSVEVFEISPLHPATGGITEERAKILSLLKQHKAGELSPTESKSLISLLKSVTKNEVKTIAGAVIQLQ